MPCGTFLPMSSASMPLWPCEKISSFVPRLEDHFAAVEEWDAHLTRRAAPGQDPERGERY